MYKIEHKQRRTQHMIFTSFVRMSQMIIIFYRNKKLSYGNLATTMTIRFFLIRFSFIYFTCSMMVAGCVYCVCVSLIRSMCHHVPPYTDIINFDWSTCVWIRYEMPDGPFSHNNHGSVIFLLIWSIMIVMIMISSLIHHCGLCVRVYAIDECAGKRCVLSVKDVGILSLGEFNVNINFAKKKTHAARHRPKMIK